MLGHLLSFFGFFVLKFHHVKYLLLAFREEFASDDALPAHDEQCSRSTVSAESSATSRSRSHSADINSMLGQLATSLSASESDSSACLNDALSSPFKIDLQKFDLTQLEALQASLNPRETYRRLQI